MNAPPQQLFVRPFVGYLLVAAITAALLATCGACAARIKPPTMWPALRDAGLAITTDCGGTKRNASAVLVAPGRALTAAHAVPCVAPVISIRHADGSTSAAHLLVADRGHDLATLAIVDGAGLEARLAAPPSEGQFVCALYSYPNRERRCAEVERVDGATITYTALTVAGNSGSGLYDVAGRLVGITIQTCVDRECGVAAIVRGIP